MSVEHVTMSSSAKAIVLAALGLGVFMVGVELMVTAVAVPSILASLTDWTQLRHASWIVNGYLVAYVAVMPLAGRAADRFNLATVYGISLAVFAIGSFAAGTAQSLDALIAGRGVQGSGGGGGGGGGRPRPPLCARLPARLGAGGGGRPGPAPGGSVGAFYFLGMA